MMVKGDIRKTFPKKKKGRPKVFPDDQTNSIRSIWPEIKTTRGIQNKVYQAYAIGVLGPEDSDDYSWLIDLTSDNIRQTILTELGRILYADDIRDFAKILCEKKLSTAESVRMIRHWRNQKIREGNASDIFKKLAATVNQYARNFPDTKQSTFIQAASILLRILKDSENVSEIDDEEG
jgi:hypothetical protein